MTKTIRRRNDDENTDLKAINTTKCNGQCIEERYLNFKTKFRVYFGKISKMSRKWHGIKVVAMGMRREKEKEKQQPPQTFTPNLYSWVHKIQILHLGFI